MVRDLTTLAKVKRFCRVKAEDLNLNQEEFELLIDELIDDVSVRAVNYCDRDWEYNDYSTTGELYSVGPLDRRQLIIGGPIIAFTKVQTRGDKNDTFSDLDSDLYTTENIALVGDRCDVSIITRIGQGPSEATMRNLAYGRYDWNQFLSSRTKRWRANWLAGYENVKVFYKYGYVTVPSDVEMIARRWVSLILQERAKKENMTVGTIRNMSINNLDPDVGIPIDISKQLEPYLTYRNSAGGI